MWHVGGVSGEASVKKAAKERKRESEISEKAGGGGENIA